LKPNFQRSAAQREVDIDTRGRKRRRYRQWLAPLEKLLSLDHPEQYLRHRRSVAGNLSDTEAVLRMRRAREAMFQDIAA